MPRPLRLLLCLVMVASVLGVPAMWHRAADHHQGESEDIQPAADHHGCAHHDHHRPAAGPASTPTGDTDPARDDDEPSRDDGDCVTCQMLASLRAAPVCGPTGLDLRLPLVTRLGALQSHCLRDMSRCPFAGRAPPHDHA